MVRIVGINDLRPRLSVLLESLAKGEPPIVITVNSEAKGVLLSCEEYGALMRTAEANKRLALKLAVANLRSRGVAAGISEEVIAEEVRGSRAAR